MLVHGYLYVGVLDGGDGDAPEVLREVASKNLQLANAYLVVVGSPDGLSVCLCPAVAL